MSTDDEKFLRAFHWALTEPAIDFETRGAASRYVPLHADGALTGQDPVRLLARAIEWAGSESVHLLAGFPGTGKSTELSRLAKVLREQGHVVVSIDIRHHLDLSGGIEVTEFLIALAGAFGEWLHAREMVGEDVDKVSYWPRLRRFLDDAQFEVFHAQNPSASFGPGSVPRAEFVLQSPPEERSRLRELLTGKSRELIQDIGRYVSESVVRLHAGRQGPFKVVLLVDSLEHWTGTSATARDVEAAADMLFRAHAQDLHLPSVHVVYTVPVHVKLLHPDLASAYDPGTVATVADVAVRSAQGMARPAALDALERVVSARGDWTRLLGGDRQRFDELALASGGNLRELLRLFAEVVQRADAVSAPPEVVQAAIRERASHLLPVANADARWLAQIAASKQIGLGVRERLGEVTRFINSSLVLGYRNGEDWYDVHPLILAQVNRQATAMDVKDKRVAPTGGGGESGPGPMNHAPLPAASPVALSADMRIRLSVENFRALRRISWTIPRGVSALVGPNGSGKTTLLDVPDLLRRAIEVDVLRALDARGGPGNLRNLTAPADALVTLGVTLDDVAWQVDLSPKGAGQSPLYNESATVAGLFHFARGEAIARLDLRIDDTRLVLPQLADRADDQVRPLLALLTGYRLYRAYDLASIRTNGSQITSDEVLVPDGKNVFSLLRNWRDRRETKARWEFVIEGLRSAFPDSFHDLDFVTAGQTVSGRVQLPRSEQRLATFFASDGLLTALLHLCAVASVVPGGLVAIDEPENALHPFAIRRVLESMNEWAERAGISVVLATHSPVLIDQFKEQPSHLFVMEPDREVQPARLDELRDAEWLAHFSLGDLYSHEEFGAPRQPS